MLAEWLWLAAVLVVAATLAAGQGWFAALDRMTYDTAVALAGRPAADDIVIVAIDDESIARIGRWPWRRAIHATLVDRLASAGSGAVALNILLSEKDVADPAGDHALADAIRRHGRVVLPVARQTLGPGLNATSLPAETFVRAGGALGHVDALPDADGVLRSIPMFAGDSVLHPQLALALLKTGGSLGPDIPPPVDDAPEPASGWRRSEPFLIPFTGPAGHYATVSYVDVLAGNIPEDALRSRMVLVGVTATGLGDTLPTPMTGRGPFMSGIEIHANVLDALASGHRIDAWPRSWVAGATALLLLLFLLGLRHLSARAGLLATILALAATILGSVLLLVQGSIWIPPAALAIALIVAYPLWAWRRLEAAQRFMDIHLDSIRSNDPGLLVAVPTGEDDPLDRRMSMIRTLADRQRLARQEHDDTMRFISHDLRSPLVSIVTLIDGLREQTVADWRGRMLQIALYAQKALDLADDFFRLAKAEAADPRKFEPVDLASVAMDAADEAWVLAERKNIVVLVENDCYTETLVNGDRSLLLRAALNLVGNAIKFSPNGTRVRITLREAGADYELAVDDQGPGFAKADEAKLFTRFGRLETQQPGVGLGLYIVKTIVERHGGTVSADSTPDGGSTFRMRLPQADSADAPRQDPF